jgi:hypothetical protein
MSGDKHGDPEGRRLARRRALFLCEAGIVARQLEVLLKRAGFDPAVCSKLIEDLAAGEKTQLMKAHGRVEPRTRFKKKLSSNPLLDVRLRNNLYVDESGRSIPHRFAPTHAPAFALGAVAVREEDVDSYSAAADEIKREFFGRVDFNFHEPNMRTRSGRYYFDGNEKRQLEFDQAIERLVRETSFVAFGVGIRKDVFEREFVETGVDPYLASDVYAVAILMLLERYVDFLAHETDPRFGRVTFESQGPREDVHHQLEYARMLSEGSQWVPESAFRNWLEIGLRFTPKAGSEPMELADMFSRDLFEWVRSGCTTTPKRWELFSEKIYCRGDGSMGKFGIKIFPDSDIRELIEAHRVRCGAASPKS